MNGCKTEQTHKARLVWPVSAWGSWTFLCIGTLWRRAWFGAVLRRWTPLCTSWSCGGLSSFLHLRWTWSSS